mgnify:CR=1 FL=1
MPDRKNYNDKSHYNFFDSSKKLTYEASKQEFEDALEMSMDQSQFWTEFKAVVISSKMTGTGDTGEVKTGLPNQIYAADLGDGITRLAMKIRIISDDFKFNAPDLPTNIITNPFDISLSDRDKQAAVRLHPTAYTFDSNFIVDSYNYGSIIEVYFDGFSSRWFITKNLSMDQSLNMDILQTAFEDIKKLSFSPAAGTTDPAAGATETEGSGDDDDVSEYYVKLAEELSEGIFSSLKEKIAKKE